MVETQLLYAGMKPAHDRPLLVAVALYLAGLIAGYCMILQHEDLLAVDSLYHVKIAHEMWTQGVWWLDIGWLPFTVLGEQGPDHHWLWHLLLAPLSAGELTLFQVQWVSVITGAAVFPAVYMVLWMLRVPYPALFTLLAMSAGVALPFRFMMARTQTLAIVLLLLACVALLRRWRVGMMLLGFVFMQAYHGAVALAAVVACFAVWDLWLNRRCQLWLLLAAPVGMLVAMMLNPWYPQNMEYLLFHVLFKVGNPQLVDVGAEWRPMHWSALLMESLAAHLLLLAAIAMTVWQQLKGRKPRLDTLMSISLALIFLIMYRDAWRFAEYYIPFAALSAALACRDWRPLWEPGRQKRTAVVTVVAVAVVGLFVINTRVVLNSNGTKLEHMAPVREQLLRYAQPGEVVFNTHWGDFTRLLWVDDRLDYVTGLDPNYLLYQDPQRYAQLIALQHGAVAAGKDPALEIVRKFSARWAYVNARHTGLAERLHFSDNALLLAQTPSGWLFELNQEEAADR